jgi:hypothetical protein
VQRLCIFLFLPLIVFSCSRYAPEINEINWQVSLFKDLEAGRTYTRLSLFLNATDNDGFEDLESFSLISDKEELFWKVDSQSWVRVSMGDRVWIGTNSIRMQDFSDIPQGDYRIMLMDFSGESDERAFQLQYDEVPLKKSQFPKPSYSQNMVKVKGDPRSYLLFLFGETNQIMGTYDLPPAGLDLTRLPTQNNQPMAQPYFWGKYTYYLYRMVEGKNLGLISGPYRFRE